MRTKRMLAIGAAALFPFHLAAAVTPHPEAEAQALDLAKQAIALKSVSALA